MRLPKRLGFALSRYVAPRLLRTLYAGLKYSVTGEEWIDSTWRAGQPTIFVGWHGRLLPLVFLYRDERLVMLVSGHRDGEYLARLGMGLGYDTVRGSSTRGGSQSVREMVRAIRDGRSLCITPDGPVGPRERFKPGALAVARITGAPVIPVIAGTTRAWWIEGWDRFLIPKPFASIKVAFGEPRTIAADANEADLEAAARDLETTLSRLKAEVDDASP